MKGLSNFPIYGYKEQDRPDAFHYLTNPKGVETKLPHQQLEGRKGKNERKARTGEGDWFRGGAWWGYSVHDPIVKEYPALLRLTNLQCFFTCIQSSIWAVAMERRPSSWNLGWGLNLITVAYCGVVVTAVTYWLRIWVVEKKGPVFVAAFTPMALLFTAIFSAIMWNETFHWGSAGGAVLLVGGLYAVLWGKHIEGKSELKSESEDTEDESKSKEETA
ncbi:hypothetical protein RHSIM_Rhsim05G0105300 [Rhododendron simsii]|uniref:WAT1-related protein n=1 Tax=Rhododendron simsii TaxID=118357 RepID=A0A834GWJ6_RHOSS|nr:hypothetical protein RHSIM_Rhsim05G0105300 [Rhododendron simsii]